jgi:transposase
MTKRSREWHRAGGPVELSYAKGSIQDAARELGIDPGRIRKWRQRHQKNDQTQPVNTTLSDEQQQIRRLQRELREAQIERDILKKAVSMRCPASSPGPTESIPIYKGKRSSIFR